MIPHADRNTMVTPDTLTNREIQAVEHGEIQHVPDVDREADPPEPSRYDWPSEPQVPTEEDEAT